MAQEVLIVGAGPAGLFAACELARYGIAARVVERSPAPHGQARATAIQPSGLEVLARAGMLEAFLENSVHLRTTRFLGPGLVEIGASNFSGIGCAHEYQCSLPQWQTERLLEDHLRQLGGAVERGTTVLSVDDETDGLRITLCRPDGQIETTETCYLLGAGGAHSITRHSMHESLDGQTYAGRYVVADIRADFPHEPETSMIYVNGEGFVLLAPLPENRWISFVDVDESSPGELDLAQLSALLNRRIDTNFCLREVGWTAHFAMHRRMAPRLTDRRRYLMGDAAHLSSPIGGQGLNSALTDAADIAWKLALVLRRRGRPVLLDSYATERSLADHRVLEVSDMLHQRVMDLISACAAGGIPTPPLPDPVQLLALGRARAMLDVAYTGSKLLGEYVGPGEPPPDGPGPGERFPDRIRLSGEAHTLLLFGKAAALDRFRERWTGLVSVEDGAALGFGSAQYGLNDGGAVLVRPDGFIGFRLAPTDTAGIEALDTHLASYLVPAVS